MRCKCISAPGGDGRICRGLLLLPSAGTASIPGRSVGEHTGPYLDLVVRWETITALYAERAFALAQIEVGHMLALLTEHLQSLGVAYYVKPADAVSPDEGALACRIHLGACAVTSPPQVSVDFSVMENEGRLCRSRVRATLLPRRDLRAGRIIRRVRGVAVVSGVVAGPWR